jgi:crotonobetainyl-CoA:carnitine CoA-transferase CaiB-like acyl-CoA transferase
MQFDGGDDAPLLALFDTLGLRSADIAGHVRITGDDPVVGGPHRTGRAAALALAAQGASLAALWQHRAGRAQDVAVDTREAVLSLNTLPFLRRNGHQAFHFTHDSDPLTAFFRCGDGRWLFLAAGYPKLRDGKLRLLNCPNDRRAIAQAVSGWRGQALEDALAEKGLTGAMVRTPEEWRSHPHGRHLAAKPVVEIERIGDAPPRTFTAGARPLSGVRVLDMTHVLAGPCATRSLAEQGADVLHVASLRPELADPLAVTIETGLGKRSATIDLGLDGDVEALLGLCRDADVFVQSRRPGLLAGKGLSAERLAALRPGIVYVTVSAFGTDGPWGGRGGFDQVAQAAIGVSACEGTPEAPQWAPAGLLCDLLTAFLAAAAIQSTLLRQAREGGNWHIKLSLAQTGMWVQGLGLRPPAANPPGIGAPRMKVMESPFGRLEHVVSPIRYSETEAAFDRPPVPVGSSPAVWL